MSEPVNFNPFSYESLLFQLISQMGKAKGGVIDSEIAKAIYPLIYNMSKGNKDISKRDIQMLKNKIPKEFKVAISALKAEHFEKKPQNKKTSFNQKFESSSKTFKKLFSKVEKSNEKELLKNDKFLEKRDVEKRDMKKHFAEFKKEEKPILKFSKKEPFLKDLKNKSPIKEKEKKIFTKEKKSFVEKKTGDKIERKDLKNSLKTLFKSSKPIFQKIIKKEIFLKKAFGAKENTQMPTEKQTISNSFPFVNFHWKKKKEERERNLKEKNKLKKVERKDLDQESGNKKKK